MRVRIQNVGGAAVNLFRTLLFWLLLAIAGAVLAQFLLRDPGFVQVRYLGTTVEMTLVGVALVAIAAGFALWLLWTTLGWPLRLWRRRRERAARAVLAEGLDALHHGRWAEAEAIFVRAAEDRTAEYPVFATQARIGAARAAAARGDAAAAEGHLDAIAATAPAARAIARAEIALDAGRPDEALAALEAASGATASPRMQALRTAALAAQAATTPEAPPSPAATGD